MAKTPMEQIGVDLPEEEAQIPQALPLAKPQENVEPDRPDWLPEKFKSPEDLARSYSELESKLGEQGRTIADLQRAIEQQPQDQQFEDPYALPADDDYLDQLYEQSPREFVALAVQQQLAAMQQQAQQQQQQYQAQMQPLYEAQQRTMEMNIANYAENEVSNRYEDWADHKDRALELLQNKNIPQHELIDAAAFTNHVDEAYRLAKFDALMGQEQEMRSAGISQDEIDRMRKQAAETLTARRSAPREQMTPDQRKAQELINAGREAGRPPWY